MILTIIFFKIKMILKMVAGGVEMKVSAGFSRICGLLVGLVLVFTANSTFAAGSVSAEECEAWFADHESETVQLQSDQLGGYLRFFYAQNRLCCHISYLLSSNETIQNSAVAVDITNANRSYSISFDAAGTDDDPCDITKCFTEPTRVGQDIYFMLEFNEKEDKNTENHADIRLIVNGTMISLVLKRRITRIQPLRQKLRQQPQEAKTPKKTPQNLCIQAADLYQTMTAKVQRNSNQKVHRAQKIQTWRIFRRLRVRMIPVKAP